MNDVTINSHVEVFVWTYVFIPGEFISKCGVINLLNLPFLSWAPDGESRFNNRLHRKLKEKFVTHSSWGSTLHTLRGHRVRSRQSAERKTERWDVGHMPLLESMDWVIWGPWVKARLVNSNQKIKFLLSSTKVFLKRAQGRHWLAWEIMLQSHTRNLTYFDSASCCPGLILAWEG